MNAFEDDVKRLLLLGFVPDDEYPSVWQGPLYLTCAWYSGRWSIQIPMGLAHSDPSLRSAFKEYQIYLEGVIRGILTVELAEESWEHWTTVAAQLREKSTFIEKALESWDAGCFADT